MSSFPFLQIAKKFGIDYGDVLLYADIHRRGTASPDGNYWDGKAIDSVSAVEAPLFPSVIDYTGPYAAVYAIIDALDATKPQTSSALPVSR